MNINSLGDRNTNGPLSHYYYPSTSRFDINENTYSPYHIPQSSSNPNHSQHPSNSATATHNSNLGRTDDDQYYQSIFNNNTYHNHGYPRRSAHNIPHSSDTGLNTDTDVHGHNISDDHDDYDEHHNHPIRTTLSPSSTYKLNQVTSWWTFLCCKFNPLLLTTSSVPISQSKKLYYFTKTRRFVTMLVNILFALVLVKIILYFTAVQTIISTVLTLIFYTNGTILQFFPRISPSPITPIITDTTPRDQPVIPASLRQLDYLVSFLTTPHNSELFFRDNAELTGNRSFNKNFIEEVSFTVKSLPASLKPYFSNSDSSETYTSPIDMKSVQPTLFSTYTYIPENVQHFFGLTNPSNSKNFTISLNFTYIYLIAILFIFILFFWYIHTMYHKFLNKYVFYFPSRKRHDPQHQLFVPKHNMNFVLYIVITGIFVSYYIYLIFVVFDDINNSNTILYNILNTIQHVIFDNAAYVNFFFHITGSTSPSRGTIESSNLINGFYVDSILHLLFHNNYAIVYPIVAILMTFLLFYIYNVIFTYSVLKNWSSSSYITSKSYERLLPHKPHSTSGSKYAQSDSIQGTYNTFDTEETLYGVDKPDYNINQPGGSVEPTLKSSSPSSLSPTSSPTKNEPLYNHRNITHETPLSPTTSVQQQLLQKYHQRKKRNFKSLLNTHHQQQQLRLSATISKNLVSNAMGISPYLKIYILQSYQVVAIMNLVLYIVAILPIFFHILINIYLNYKNDVHGALSNLVLRGKANDPLIAKQVIATTAEKYYSLISVYNLLWLYLVDFISPLVIWKMLLVCFTSDIVQEIQNIEFTHHFNEFMEALSDHTHSIQSNHYYYRDIITQNNFFKLIQNFFHVIIITCGVSFFYLSNYIYTYCTLIFDLYYIHDDNHPDANITVFSMRNLVFILTLSTFFILLFVICTVVIATLFYFARYYDTTGNTYRKNLNKLYKYNIFRHLYANDENPYAESTTSAHYSPVSSSIHQHVAQQFYQTSQLNPSPRKIFKHDDTNIPSTHTNSIGSPAIRPDFLNTLPPPLDPHPNNYEFINPMDVSLDDNTNFPIDLDNNGSGPCSHFDDFMDDFDSDLDNHGRNQHKRSPTKTYPSHKNDINHSHRDVVSYRNDTRGDLTKNSLFNKSVNNDTKLIGLKITPTNLHNNVTLNLSNYILYPTSTIRRLLYQQLIVFSTIAILFAVLLLFLSAFTEYTIFFSYFMHYYIKIANSYHNVLISSCMNNIAHTDTNIFITMLWYISLSSRCGFSILHQLFIITRQLLTIFVASLYTLSIDQRFPLSFLLSEYYQENGLVAAHGDINNAHSHYDSSLFSFTHFSTLITPLEYLTIGMIAFTVIIIIKTYILPLTLPKINYNLIIQQHNPRHGHKIRNDDQLGSDFIEQSPSPQPLSTSSPSSQFDSQYSTSTNPDDHKGDEFDGYRRRNHEKKNDSNTALFGLVQQLFISSSSRKMAPNLSTKTNPQNNNINSIDSNESALTFNTIINPHQNASVNILTSQDKMNLKFHQLLHSCRILESFYQIEIINADDDDENGIINVHTTTSPLSSLHPHSSPPQYQSPLLINQNSQHGSPTPISSPSTQHIYPTHLPSSQQLLQMHNNDLFVAKVLQWLLLIVVVMLPIAIIVFNIVISPIIAQNRGTKNSFESSNILFIITNAFWNISPSLIVESSENKGDDFAINTTVNSGVTIFNLLMYFYLLFLPLVLIGMLSIINRFYEHLYVKYNRLLIKILYNDSTQSNNGSTRSKYQSQSGLKVQGNHPSQLLPNNHQRRFNSNNNTPPKNTDSYPMYNTEQSKPESFY